MRNSNTSTLSIWDFDGQNWFDEYKTIQRYYTGKSSDINEKNDVYPLPLGSVILLPLTPTYPYEIVSGERFGVVIHLQS